MRRIGFLTVTRVSVKDKDLGYYLIFGWFKRRGHELTLWLFKDGRGARLPVHRFKHQPTITIRS